MLLSTSPILQTAALLIAAHLFVAPSTIGAEISFTDVTDAAGLREPLTGLMGHGAAWGDFDDDGKIDLFVGGFADRPAAEYAPAFGPGPNKLFHNLGGGRFGAVPNASVETYARTSGAIFADLDNNGTLELYVANNAKQKRGHGQELRGLAQMRHSQLFRNDAGALVEVSAQSGACPETLFSARNIGVFDYDGDGLLDLFLVEDKFTRAPRSVLLRNNGGLIFTDVSREAGLPEDIFGLGLAVADLNDDGRPDIFVAHSNRLFLSQSGKRYREATELASVFAHEPFDGEDWPCGAAFGDLNRDGRLDLVVSAHSNRARNRVFLNNGLENGVPRFYERTREVGVSDVVPVKCPHVEIQDFDNDGWPDLFLSAAWLEEGRVVPLVYRHTGLHDGIPRFTPLRSVQSPMVYYPAGPAGDFDNDGRIDLFLVNWFQGDHSRLMRNESAPRHWLQIRVRGRKMNRMGLGAQTRIYRAGKLGDASGLLGFQEMNIGFGYASGQAAVSHFGLGDAATVDLAVRLPQGTVINRVGVKADQLLIVDEP
jgi:hypothetical protein